MRFIRATRNQLSRALIGAALIGFTASATAETPIEKLRGLVGDDIRIDHVFAGPSGLVGLVLQDREGGPTMLGWATPELDHLMLGHLMDAHGRNLTDLAAEAYEASNPVNLTLARFVQEWLAAAETEADPSSLPVTPLTFQEVDTVSDDERAWRLARERVTAGGALTEGDGRAGTLYVYVDLACPHCANLHRGLETLDLSDFTVHWLPLSLSPESHHHAIAADVLASGQPEAMKAAFDDRSVFSRPLDDGPEVPAIYRQRVQDNHLALQASEMGGVPSVVLHRPGSDPVMMVGPQLDAIRAWLR